MRRAEAEALAGTGVEFGGDTVAVGLGEVAEVRAFGEVLSDEPVGILAGATFPGMMRRSEVDPGSERALEVAITVELGSVVCGERTHRMRFATQQLDEALVGMHDGGSRKRSDAHQP